MNVISLPRGSDHAEHVSDIEKYIGESKAEFSLVISEVLNSENPEAREAESLIFRRLSEQGLFLLRLCFATRNRGNYGKTTETAQGQARRGGTVEKTYFWRS